MKLSKLAMYVSFPLFMFSGCSFPAQVTVFQDFSIRPKAQYVTGCEPTRDALETVVSTVWDSEFLVREPKVLEEILNNSYGVFDSKKGPVTPKCKDCFGIYYKKPGFQDLILVNSKLFCYKGDVLIPYMNQSYKATVLVHELFHDFWDHIFEDSKKEQFIKESTKFYNRIANAKTDADKLLLLNEVGLVGAGTDTFDTVLGSLVATRGKYIDCGSSDEEFFGTELFAIFAETAYAGAGIPRPLQVFYRNLISEKRFGGHKVYVFP